MSSNQKSRHNNKSGRHNHKQNNRSRNQNNRGGRKGSGRKQSQQPLTATKQIDSNGPAGKLRGNVKQLYDKYKALAHDNKTKDRTSSEAYGQYAHHYYTLYSEFAAAEAAQQLERENEKARRLQEDAEDQANIVPILETEGRESKQEDDQQIEVEKSPEDAKPDTKGPDSVQKKKRTRARKKPEAAAPELPLEPVGDEEKPAKQRRTRKAPEKAKEEVAE